MKYWTAEETLIRLIELCSSHLEELQQRAVCGEKGFICGEKTAYVECLEIIQRWGNAQAHGLNYDIESRFPLL